MKFSYNKKTKLKRAHKANIEAFLKRFREHYVSTDLIRVGGQNDGGYLIPDILDEIEFCFSPGVDVEASFEQHLSKSHGIVSFMADASVESAPFADSNFVFNKLFLGNRNDGDFVTLKTWLEAKVGLDSDNLLLQMDIEGGEYDVLITESAETLKRFVCICIEFHFVDKIFDSAFFRMFTSVFEKIFQEFSICHVHPNNCCGIVSVGGINVPRVFEVTFLRNDFVQIMKNTNPIVLPHRLDRKNVENEGDILMPEVWWRSPLDTTP